MTTKLYFRLCIALFLLLLTSCQGASHLLSPQFVNHTKPALSIDFSPFENVGCPPDQYGYRRCEEGSSLAALSCDEIAKPSDLLGGLDPSYPIAVCSDHSWGREEGRYFFNAGGIRPAYVRYVIFRDGQFKLIETKDEFRKAFAPVTTEEEALSYALAVQNLSAYYNLGRDSELQYFVDTIEDTYVETTTDGYLVHLFYYKVFGCGPHFTYAADVKVTTQGYVEEVNRKKIYKDPLEDGLCVD